MEFIQILIVFLGLNTIVGGIAILRLRKLSPQDVADQRVRPAVTGISAILMAVAIMFGGVVVVFWGLYPDNLASRFMCNGIFFFYPVIVVLSGILEGIRRRL